jgi:hypothetical protein
MTQSANYSTKCEQIGEKMRISLLSNPEQFGGKIYHI